MTGFSGDRTTEEHGTGQSAETPPRPPPIDRRLALTRKQRVGLPLLVAIPLLALLGLFGERRAETRATSRSLAVTIRYPERFRYRQIQSLEITVRNLTSKELDSIHVSLDTAYVTRFSSVRIDPQPTAAYVVDLAHVKPGESRLISAELWGQDYGRHRGRISVFTTNDSVSVAISTLVFP